MVPPGITDKGFCGHTLMTIADDLDFQYTLRRHILASSLSWASIPHKALSLAEPLSRDLASLYSILYLMRKDCMRALLVWVERRFGGFSGGICLLDYTVCSMSCKFMTLYRRQVQTICSYKISWMEMVLMWFLHEHDFSPFGLTSLPDLIHYGCPPQLHRDFLFLSIH